MSKFLQATKQPREAQRRTLLAKLARNKDSEWGKRFNFANIKTIKEFQKSLPLADYDTFLPYIEKLKAGETQAFFGKGEKLLGFGLTSGTTGKPKFIPFTRSFVREYKRGALLFVQRIVEDKPKLMEGKILAVFSPAREYQTEGGIWCGSVSGWIAEHQSSIIRSFYALPNAVLEIKDTHARYYTLMRIALTKDISALMTANPSTVLTLIKLANDNKNEIIRDIRDGTLSVKNLIPGSVYKAIKPHLKKDPPIAHKLERLACENEFFAPRHYWPNLQFVLCWKGGTLFTYVDQFPKYFSESTAIKDIGLLATEGRLTIPIISGEDAGVPAIDSVFFEFIPEGDEDSSNPRTLLIDELERDKNYFLVITTSSGFTRYRIHDLVRVVGFLNKIPLIHFLNKGKHISSLTGEKISEHQVVTAAHDVSKEFNIHLSHFTMCPCWSELPYYALLAEEHELGDRSNWPKFVARLDKRLQELNMEYQSKRKTGRLDSMRLKVVGRGCFESRKGKGRHLEGRLEQYKHVYLCPTIDFYKDFPVSEVVTSD